VVSGESEIEGFAVMEGLEARAEGSEIDASHAATGAKKLYRVLTRSKKVLSEDGTGDSFESRTQRLN
jgi:hypothetical protein